MRKREGLKLNRFLDGLEQPIKTLQEEIKKIDGVLSSPTDWRAFNPFRQALKMVKEQYFKAVKILKDAEKERRKIEEV